MCECEHHPSLYIFLSLFIISYIGDYRFSSMLYLFRERFKDDEMMLKYNDICVMCDERCEMCVCVCVMCCSTTHSIDTETQLTQKAYRLY